MAFNLSDAFGTARFGQQSIQQGSDLASALAVGFIRRINKEEEEKAKQEAEGKALFGGIASLAGAAIGSQVTPDNALMGATVGAEAGKALIGRADTSNILSVGLKQEELRSQEARSLLDLQQKANLAKEKATVDQKNDIQQQENTLRKEFNNTYTKFRDVMNAAKKVNSSLEQDSAAGDLAGIFSFMKTIDPGSTVREGEFATAQNSAGVPDRIRVYFNQLNSGKRLSPKQRQDFIDTARNAFKNEEDTFRSEYNRYKSIANNQNLDVKNIFGRDVLESILGSEVANPTQPTSYPPIPFKGAAPAAESYTPDYGYPLPTSTQPTTPTQPTTGKTFRGFTLPN